MYEICKLAQGTIPVAIWELISLIIREHVLSVVDFGIPVDYYTH